MNREGYLLGLRGRHHRVVERLDDIQKGPGRIGRAEAAAWWRRVPR